MGKEKGSNKKIIAELRRLADDNDGLLTPEVVVDAAKPRMSPLHDQFTWNDGEAAYQYRLWQARVLLRVTVEYMPTVKRNVRVFVSLTPDREKTGGGYRPVVEILSDADHRKQLLADALAELAYFKRKYGMLKELTGIWRAVAKLMK